MPDSGLSQYIVTTAAVGWLASVSGALAQPVDIPLLADGQVDYGAVNFSAITPLYSSGDSRHGSGSFLDMPFRFEHGEVQAGEPFPLTFTSGAMTQHASFILARMLIDTTCLKRDLRPGELFWQKTAKKIAGGWTVVGTCSDRPSS